MKHLFNRLTRHERNIFGKLTSHEKIQDFLDVIPMNFERGGDTIFSPRQVLRKKRAHCFEGALFAAAAFLFHGERPRLLDLKVTRPDDHHVVCLFKKYGKWGAISKTNHAVLRYRDPVYKNPRELAMSYFHEYFLENGKKTLRSYAVFDIRRIKRNWVISEEDLWFLDRALNAARHIPILSQKEIKTLRRASRTERRALALTEWKN